MTCEVVEQFVTSVVNAGLQQGQRPVSVGAAVVVALLLLPVSGAVAVVSYTHLGDFHANKKNRFHFSGYVSVCNSIILCSSYQGQSDNDEVVSCPDLGFSPCKNILEYLVHKLVLMGGVMSALLKHFRLQNISCVMST